MATHSSVLAWRIPGMGEPGGLPSMGSQSRTRLKRLSSSSSTLVKAGGTFIEPQLRSDPDKDAQGQDGPEQGSMECHIGLEVPVWTVRPLAREQFKLGEESLLNSKCSLKVSSLYWPT